MVHLDKKVFEKILVGISMYYQIKCLNLQRIVTCVILLFFLKEEPCAFFEIGNTRNF